MTNNDILRSIRYALNTDNATMCKIFALSEYDMDESTLLERMRKEDEPGFVECSDRLMRLFLDGLVIMRRGKREMPVTIEAMPAPAPEKLTNNDVLKKLRVAFDLKGDDVLDMVTSVGHKTTMSQVNALFRKKDHRNYVECGDQFMRYFLKALPAYIKPVA